MTDNEASVQDTSGELKCPSCGSEAMVIGKSPYHIRGEYIGEFEAVVCKSCNYTLFTSTGYDKAMVEARKRGLVGPPEEMIFENTTATQEQQLIIQESKTSVFILQFTEEAPADTIKDQNNRHINMKFIKTK